MINEDYYTKLAQVESNNNPLAKNPKTTAKGKYQFIDSTSKQYGLDKVEFGTPEYEKAEEAAVRRFTQDNYDSLKNALNRNPDSADLYLAHQQGVGGATKLLTADETAKAIDVLGVDEVLNNGGNENMTVSEFKQKWVSKFDDMTAEERGLGGDKPIEVDAFKDFGVTIGDNSDIDAFKDFNVTIDDEFAVNTDEFGNINRSIIDQKTGAPSYIRQVVGSLYDPESRLATLQKYYPDARPYGDNNFIFTNPETKKPTLYNPKGIDVGDTASLTKEAFITTGAGIGGFIGGVVGAGGGPAAPATVPGGVILGSGFGAGIASNLYDAWMTLTGQTVDVRRPGERILETGIDVVGTAAGEVIGQAIPVVAKGVIGGGKATSRAIVSQFQSMGITPTLSVSGGASAKRLEAGLAQNMISASTMEKQAAEIVKQSSDALGRIVAKYGKPRTKEGAGTVIYDAAEKAVMAFEKKQEKLYTDAFDAVGSDTVVNLQSVKQLLSTLKSRLANAPNSPTMQKAVNPAIKELEAIVNTEKLVTKKISTGLLDDTGNQIMREMVEREGAGFQFNTLRDIRSRIGAEIGDPLTRTLDKQGMSQVYAALTEDMGRTVAGVSDDAARKISRADTYTKAWKETAAKSLEKILKYDADEKAYKFALSASKDGGTSLRKLRKLFTPEEWDDVAATVLNQLGENPVNGDFSISKFVTNYNKLAPEAKDALFKGGRYKDAGDALDNFIDVMGQLKDVSRYANTSNTAGAIQTDIILRSLAGVGIQGIVGAGAGEQAGIGGWAGAAGAIMAPKLAARLVTNPAFVKWLSQPVGEGVQDMGKHLGRLIAIGEANPELKESIEALIDAMRENTK